MEQSTGLYYKLGTMDLFKQYQAEHPVEKRKRSKDTDGNLGIIARSFIRLFGGIIKDYKDKIKILYSFAAIIFIFAVVIFVRSFLFWSTPEYKAREKFLKLKQPVLAVPKNQEIQDLIRQFQLQSTKP